MRLVFVALTFLLATALGMPGKMPSEMKDDWIPQSVLNQEGIDRPAPSPTPLPLLASHFTDHMVLQRGGAGALVWGFMPTGTKVGVNFANQDYTGVSDFNNTWRVRLDPLPAGGPYTLTVTSGNLTTVVADILMGDVYLAGGQSNMEFTVDQAFNATQEVNASLNYPNIRVFTVGSKFWAPYVVYNLVSITQNWSVAAPESVGMGNWTAITAVGWFFARDVYDGLKGEVPIGLISVNWGGTVIQTWTSPESIAHCNGTGDSNLYHSLLNPFFVGPLALTGAVWYQGENNGGQEEYYKCAFPTMIQDWRARLAMPNMWFGGVQLAPASNGVYAENFVGIRDAQLSIFTLSNTSLATAMDLGDALSPFGDYHPRLKQPVGQRLAANALVKIYGQNLPHLSPVFLNATAATPSDPNTVSVTVTFVPETVVDGLTLVEQPPCPLTGKKLPYCAGFQIQLNNATGPWVNATAALGADNTVLVSADAGPGDTAFGIKNCHTTWPLASLYSGAGFPAYPWYANVTM